MVAPNIQRDFSSLASHELIILHAAGAWCHMQTNGSCEEKEPFNSREKVKVIKAAERSKSSLTS